LTKGRDAAKGQKDSALCGVSESVEISVPTSGSLYIPSWGIFVAEQHHRERSLPAGQGNVRRQPIEILHGATRHGEMPMSRPNHPFQSTVKINANKASRLITVGTKPL
jgi:hypothetical protein